MVRDAKSGLASDSFHDRKPKRSSLKETSKDAAEDCASETGTEFKFHKPEANPPRPFHP